MKRSLISLVFTALLVTSFLQPYQHISAESLNNTDQGINGCIGLNCLIVEDDEADLFMGQLGSIPPLKFNTDATRDRDKNSACPSAASGRYTSCLNPAQLMVTCERTNRAYPCRRQPSL